jgi:hypothetical protein
VTEVPGFLKPNLIRSKSGQTQKINALTKGAKISHDLRLQLKNFKELVPGTWTTRIGVNLQFKRVSVTKATFHVGARQIMATFHVGARQNGNVSRRC